MKRNKGYLEVILRDSFLELARKKIITILDRNKLCFYLNTHNLFFKEEENTYLELIGCRISELLGINTVSYDMLKFVTTDGNYSGVIASDFRAVEVDYANEYKSASSAAGSLKASIKRFKLESTITCISSNGRVYLINLMKRRY